MADLLDSIPIDACPACGTVLQELRCRGCGFVRPAPAVRRPTGGDALPGIGA